MKATRIAKRGRLKKKLHAAKKVIDFQAQLVNALRETLQKATKETHERTNVSYTEMGK